jgi:hypothetical protein
MPAPPKIRLERLPKRDAVVRLRAVYACLERGWQTRQRVATRQSKSKFTKQEEVR